MTAAPWVVAGLLAAWAAVVVAVGVVLRAADCCPHAEDEA